MPIEPVQSSTDPLRELVDSPQHELKITFRILGGQGRLPFRLKAGQTCLEAGKARLELVGINDPLRIPVNQTVDAVAQPDNLTVEDPDVAGRTAVPRRHDATLMLSGDPLRIVQHSLDLLPYRLLQLVAAHRTVAARSIATVAVRIRAGAAIVAIVGRPSIPDQSTRHLAVKGVAAQPAHDESLQQPSRSTPPLAFATTVLVQLRLGGLEYANIDDRRHRDRDPFRSGYRRRTGRMTGGLRMASDRAQPGLGGCRRARPSEHRSALVGRVAQHATQGGGVPACQPRPGRTIEGSKATAGVAQADLLDADPVKELTHHVCLLINDFDLRHASSGEAGEIAIAVGHGAKGTDGTGQGGMAAPAAAPFENTSALIFGDHALDLQKQIVFGRTSDCAVEEDNLNTGTAKLFHQQHLVGIPSGKPVGSQHIDAIQFAGRDRITHPFQSGARQHRPAPALIHVRVIGADHRIIGSGAFPQGRDLTRYGVTPRLAVARHAGIKAGRDPIHVQLPSASSRRRVNRRGGLPAASGDARSARPFRRLWPSTARRSAPPRTRCSLVTRDRSCAGPCGPPSTGTDVSARCPVIGLV